MKVLTVTDAATELLRGAVVAIPTDTVYGFAAALNQPAAIAALFEAKQRPGNVALPVLVATPAEISSLGVDLPEAAQVLVEAFWPGPLTIVVPVPSEVAALVGAIDTVGFRQPALSVTRELLELTGPLAVSSANRHGAEPCVSTEQIFTTFGDAPIAGVLDGGRCDGVVSTVVELDSTWTIRRPGAISRQAIAGLLGPEG